MEVTRWSLIRRFVIVVALLPAVLNMSANAAGESAQPAASPAAKGKSPNVILITLDTTRADRMGFMGSKRGLTQNLDAFAQRSVVFTRAYSQAPLTPTSHATILTGTYPQYHQVITFPVPLGKDIPYLPQSLKDHGYSTAAFVGSIALEPTWGAPGFERAFDTYDSNYSWKGYSPATRYQTVENRAGDVVARAIAWVNRHQKGPFFLWVHLFDPHEPYDPPEPYKTRYAKAPYDGEIAYTDSALGKFFRQLKAAGLYDGALIAVTADHGESLGAHGEDTHGIFVYDETIHVPLVIKPPHGGLVGKRVEDRVELADIMPTILGSLGVAVPEKVQGQSLLGFTEPTTAAGTAAAQAWRDRGAYSQADYGHLSFAWSMLRSLRTGKYLYIQAPHRELYDDAADPNAEHNLATEASAVADTLSAKVEDFLQKTTNSQEAAKVGLDDTQMKQLVMLGYMPSRGDSADAAPGEVGADPKDKIAFGNIVVKINNLLRDFHCVGGMAELQHDVAILPDVAMLHFFLGGCYIEQSNYDKGIPELRKAVELDPGYTRAEIHLGTALMHIGEYDAATTAFEHVVKTEPTVVDPHIYLIVLYGKANRPKDVVTECRAVLHIIPDNWGANLNLGMALSQLGDLDGAIAPLQKAATLQPDKPRPHTLLADVYSRLGRDEDAKRELAEAERLGAAPKGSITPSPDAAPESNPSQPN
jgi:arylsulfatase A-like enzyme/Flp pilus assembly protein TadD